MCVISRLILSLGLTLVVIQPVTANPLSVDDVQNIALADNPLLGQISARYAAALEVPDQVGSLPDPTLSLSMLNVPTDSFELDQENMTQMQVGISQALPWFDQLDAASSSARYQAQATESELHGARNLLRRDVIRVWWDLYFVERSLAVTDENLERLREFNLIAQSRYRVGKGLQQDILQAQMVLSTQLENRLRLRNQQRKLTAQLNALLARPAEDRLAILIPSEPEPLSLPTLDTLIKTAMLSNPAVRQSEHLVKAAEDRKEVARIDLRPDISLAGAYGYRQDRDDGSDRSDFLSVSLSLKLPIYAATKQSKKINQRGAELVSQEEALYRTQLNIRKEVVQAASDYQLAIEQQQLLMQGIIPQSQQTVASMLAGYQVNKVDFSALIQAQLISNRVQLQYWKALSDSQKALASINAAAGGDLNLESLDGSNHYE